MTIQEILNLAINVDAADIFLVAGLPVTFKVGGRQQRLEEGDLMPGDIRALVDEIYEISGPLDLTVLMKVYGLPGFEEYKMPSYKPKAVPELMNDDDIFTNIRKGDILLQHPYQTFEPVIGLIEAAAEEIYLAVKDALGK